MREFRALWILGSDWLSSTVVRMMKNAATLALLTLLAGCASMPRPDIGSAAPDGHLSDQHAIWVSPPLPEDKHVERAGWAVDGSFAFCALDCDGALKCEVWDTDGHKVSDADDTSDLRAARVWRTDVTFVWDLDASGIKVDAEGETGTTTICHFDWSDADNMYPSRFALSPDGETMAIVFHSYWGEACNAAYDVQMVKVSQLP